MTLRGDHLSSNAKEQAKLLPFDAARYLSDEAAIAEYMTVVLEMDDPDLLLMATEDIARAKGMLLALHGRHGPWPASPPRSSPT